MIKEYRRKIDEIDEDLALLLSKRLLVASRIGSYKSRHGLPVLDKKREDERRAFFAGYSDPDKRRHMINMINAIMEESRKCQLAEGAGYALLGRKLGYSISPQVHKLLGGYDFGLIEMEPDQLDYFFEKRDFCGICVTMPYKTQVIKYCDRLSETARDTGSVNVIVREEDGSLSGHNTDYEGYKYSVEKSGLDIKGAKCLILGSGGVSETVKKVLHDLGASKILKISRTGENNYLNLEKHHDADIIVNATPVGTYPDEDLLPVDISRFTRCRGVFDLIYNPLRTGLMLAAEDMGIPAFGGMDMLICQAACACRLFTGRDEASRIEEVTGRTTRDCENIIFIGMPGCGKSSVGKKLAEITNKEFIDTDMLIRESFGMSPEEMIKACTEEYFRDREEEIIKQASLKRGSVIATGGGVVEREKNYKRLRKSGRIVYLSRELSELSCEGRPLSMEAGLRSLFERREALYKSWSELEAANAGIDECAQQIAIRLGYI